MFSADAGAAQISMLSSRATKSEQPVVEHDPFQGYETAEDAQVVMCDEEAGTYAFVARFMKYGNRLVFMRDLEKKLEDLSYTKAHLLISQSRSAVSTQGDSELLAALNTIRQCMEEATDIGDIDLADRFQQYERMVQTRHRGPSMDSDSTSLQDFTDSPPSANNTKEHSGSYCDGFLAEFSLFSKSKNQKPKVLDVSAIRGKRRFDRSLRGLHELCSWGAKEGLQRLRAFREILRVDGPESFVNRLHSFGGEVNIPSLGSVDSFKSFVTPFQSFDEDTMYSATSSLDNMFNYSRQTSVSDPPLSRNQSDPQLEDTELIFVHDYAASEFENTLTMVLLIDLKMLLIFESDFESKDQYDLNESKQGNEDSSGDMFVFGKEPLRGSLTKRLSNSASSDSVKDESHLKKKWSNLQHVVYSLLVGRPVIVIGTRKQESAIREMIQALALFVSSTPRTSSVCMLCQLKQLKMADIHKVQLRGIIRPDKRSAEYLLPQSIRRYITIVDTERGLILCQPYQGQFLSFLSALQLKKKTFKTGNVLLPFLQLDASFPHRAAMLELSSEKYLNRAGIMNSDCRIIKHLAEAVKVQQIEEEFQCKYLTDAPAFPFSVQHQSLQTFKL
ncbi:SMR8B-like protein [Mya arenaria]|uniref:SMR8B-like protein n=1 Tax=Mya arenaria TaxID=6604 RepID=A0ABY7EGG2_MYAAR|nr:SMR8B-like protein [Mya arenaria]